MTQNKKSEIRRDSEGLLYLHVVRDIALEEVKAVAEAVEIVAEAVVETIEKIEKPAKKKKSRLFKSKK